MCHTTWFSFLFDLFLTSPLSRPGTAFGKTHEYSVYVPLPETQYNLTSLEYNSAYRVWYRVWSEVGQGPYTANYGTGNLFYTGGLIDPVLPAEKVTAVSTDDMLVLKWPKWNGNFRGDFGLPNYQWYTTTNPNCWPENPTAAGVVINPDTPQFAVAIDLQYSQPCRMTDHCCVNANPGTLCLQADARNGGLIWVKMVVYDTKTQRYGKWTETQEFACTSPPETVVLTALDATHTSISVGWTSPNM